MQDLLIWGRQVRTRLIDQFEDVEIPGLPATKHDRSGSVFDRDARMRLAAASPRRRSLRTLRYAGVRVPQRRRLP